MSFTCSLSFKTSCGIQSRQKQIVWAWSFFPCLENRRKIGYVPWCFSSKAESAWSEHHKWLGFSSIVLYRPLFMFSNVQQPCFYSCTLVFFENTTERAQHSDSSLQEFVASMFVPMLLRKVKATEEKVQLSAAAVLSTFATESRKQVIVLKKNFYTFAPPQLYTTPAFLKRWQADRMLQRKVKFVQLLKWKSVLIHVGPWKE